MYVRKTVSGFKNIRMKTLLTVSIKCSVGKLGKYKNTNGGDSYAKNGVIYATSSRKYT